MIIQLKTQILEKCRKIETANGKVNPFNWCRKEAKRMNKARARRGENRRVEVAENHKSVWIQEAE